MLSPHDRASLFEALRPPEGFTLDAAAGTSFTLDLEALLTAPIAFALHEASAAETDEAGVEPVGLLESIRRHAARITLFCQGGQIAVPRRRRAVFAWLEDTVVEVAAPEPNRLFHPKVWLVRYRGADSDAYVLRVLCATRNLTFDTSWDTLLRVETAPYHRGEAGQIIDGQAALAGLFRRLPDLAHRPPTTRQNQRLAALAEDLERVPLIPPPPFTTLAFHVLGLGPQPSSLPSESSKALVISPFVAEGFIARLLSSHRLAALISREDALDGLSASTRGRIERLAVLNPTIDADPAAAEEEHDPDADDVDTEAAAMRTNQDGGDPARPLAGLHAKLFLFDTPDGARVFTGSANATDAAFSGNIEVLAELRGPATTGVDAVLGDTPGETGLADTLIDYDPREEPDGSADADELDWRLGELRRALSELDVTATVAAAGDDYTLSVTSSRPLPAPDLDSLELWLYPVTLDEDASAQPLVPGQAADAAFTVTLEGISAFLAVGAAARHGEARQTSRFLINARLEGAPEDRHSRLLAGMLRDRDRLLRYLLLLLHDPSSGEGELTAGAGRWVGRWLGGGWNDLPLLELLLRAVDRHPERLDHIERLLADLGAERGELLPEEFDAVWEPIWRYRQEARR